MEYHRSGRYLTEILSLGERGMFFVWGKHSQGLANLWEQPAVHKHSRPLRRSRQRSRRSWQKKSSLPQKQRAEQ